MIEHVFSRIAQYGRDMTVTDTQGVRVVCKGFLQPVDTLTETFPDWFKAPGTGPENRLFLLAAPEALTLGHTAETVTCGGQIYDVLGMQPIYCGMEITHWEGVVRERGGNGWS